MRDLSVLQRQLVNQQAHLSQAKSVLEQGGEEKYKSRSISLNAAFN
jgi:hypothetical protein